MDLDNELKIQNPFKRDSQGGWNNENYNQNNNYLVANNINQYNHESNPFPNNELENYSGYNETSNINHENNINQDADNQGLNNFEQNQLYYNQHLMDYEPGMLDDQDGIQNQFQNAMMFNEYQNKYQDQKNNYKKGKRQNQGKLYQAELQIEKYEKVSEYLLQADNHSLNGIRNMLTYQQNRNFLFQERCCLEIMHKNNQLFNFEAYKCTMIMCGILLDASISLIKDNKYYLAEKYLLRAKFLTEPKQHLRKGINNESKQRKQLTNKDPNEQNEEYNNNQNNEEGEDDSQEEKESNFDDDEDIIFEKDIRYHDIRIEIALNLCDVYKQQMKILKKKKKNQSRKLTIQYNNYGQTMDGNSRKFDATGNEIGGMKEIKEEHELEMELEKFDNNLNVSPSNPQMLSQLSPNKEKQVFFTTPHSNISAVTNPKHTRQNSYKKIGSGDEEERKVQGGAIKNNQQQVQQYQKQKEMDEEEEKDEEEKQQENKMEKALKVLNDIESKLTEEYIDLSKQDLKGTLCKFYSKKVEILNELLKYAKDQYDEQEVEEMSKEMLTCAQFVIGTLESILLPLKANESPQSQEDSVYLATILSYTWTKLGKYLLKTNEIDKAIQCYKNAYERLQNFFKEGNDRMFLQDKFKRKYDKFMGKLAFERLGDVDVIEFSQFEDDIMHYQSHQANIQASKKNYLVSKNGFPISDMQSPSGQFYVDPEYLNQLKSHYTVKSLNKHRHLKKIPISHPFGSAMTVITQQQPQITAQNQQNTSQQGQQIVRSFKFKKNLQLQLENYKNQIIGSSVNTFTNQTATNNNNNNYNLNEFNIQPKTTGAQIELSPDERNVPFIIPSKKPRQHPQSAKVRSTNSARRHYNGQGNEDQSMQTTTNLGNLDQQTQKQPLAKKGLHKKAPSLSNAQTKISNTSTRVPQDDRLQNQEGPFGNGLSYTSIPSTKRESLLQNKFIQDDSQSQVPSIQSQSKNLFTSQGYYLKKKKEDESNTNQLSFSLKQGQFGSLSKGQNISQSSLLKSFQSPKQQSLHQFPASQQGGFSSTNRIMSAKVRSQGINTGIPQNQQMQQQQKILNQQGESDMNLNQDGLNSTNKIEPLSSGRSQIEGVKSPNKQLTTRNNSVTNDMLDNIVNFVDQMYEVSTQKNSILNSNKSTSSTTNRNPQNQRPSSSNLYFSTNRLFSNASIPQSTQKQQYQQDQDGIIYEKYEGNDYSQQNIKEDNQQERFIESSSRDQYYPQQKQQQEFQIKKQIEGNRFLVINQRPTQSVKNAEKIFNTLGNLRIQLNNLFDSGTSSNANKYSIKLNQQQNEEFMNMINRRPSGKLDQNNTIKTALSSRKSSQQQIQPGQFGMNNYNQDMNEQEDDNYQNINNKQRIKNAYKGQKHQTRSSIKFPFQNNPNFKQIKSLTQFEDANKKGNLGNKQQVMHAVQDRKSEGSSRRLNTVEKSTGKIKDLQQSQQLQQGQQNSQQIGSNMYIQFNQPQASGNTYIGQGNNLYSSQINKNQQNPSPTAKEKEKENQSTFFVLDNQDAQSRNALINNMSVLKKKNTENLHDSSMVSIPPLTLQQNQISNQDNSRILKSSKIGDQALQNKQGQINNSKMEDKNLSKPQIRRLSTNITDNIFKRQATSNYEQIQIEIAPIQANNEDDKRLSSHFATPFIKQKFDQFENMNNVTFKNQNKSNTQEIQLFYFQNLKDRNNKNQNKINETQSSQEDDDGDEQDVSEVDQKHTPYQMLDDLQALNQGDELRGGEDNNFNVVGDELKKSDKRLGNSVNLKISQGGKLAQQSPEISRMMASQQQVQIDHNKSFPHHLHMDQGASSLHQSFLQQQYQANTQSNQGLHDKSLMMNNSQIATGMAANTKGMNTSQNLKPQNPQINQNKEIQIKTLHFPSVKQSKFLFVQNRIQELLFVPLYFYKSYNSYSLCQWNVTNIIIELENVSVEEDAEDVEQLLKQNTKANQQNKGGLPFTSDKIRYDIKLQIFLECVITDQHIINNPLIFYLKNQSLNFIYHLWPNDKSKIETKYELAILLLDRWIKERDVDAVEEFYNIGLSIQNVQVQFVLRGGNNYQEFQKLISKEQASSQCKVQSPNGGKFDQIRLFGEKINFIINKIAQVMKKVHGDILKLPNDLNEIINSQLNVRQNNLKSLRRHQNKRRELRNIISYFKIEQVHIQYILELQKYKGKKTLPSIGIGESIPQRQEIVSQSIRERGQLRFNDTNFEKSNSNGVEVFLEDEQYNGYQRLSLNKGLSNESPVYQKNVDFSEFSDMQARKRLSTRDQFPNNSNINNSIQQQIPTSSSNAQSSNLSNIPFLGPQSSQQQSFQLQLFPGVTNNSNHHGYTGRFQQKKANILNPSIHSINSQSQSRLQPSTHSNVARAQKYHYLKYKMKERLYQIQKESDPSIPLETQVNYEMMKKLAAQDASASGNPAYTSEYAEGTQESIVQGNNTLNISPTQRQIMLQPVKYDTEYSSPRQFNLQNPRLHALQGFSSAIEDQLQGTSPRNNSVGKEGFSEESSLQLQRDSQKQAEEYKKKYELAVTSAVVSNTSTPQGMNVHSLLLHHASSNKQNNLRIEHLKRQVRDNLQSQQQNYSNAVDQSQSYSESPKSFAGNNSQNNSFVSSYNSSATSPTNLVGPSILQRMPSILSNKSSKSKFSKYAPNNNEDLNESMSSPMQALVHQNKKSSQFARLNSKYDSMDGQEDSSQKSPPPLQPDNESTEYFPPTGNEDLLQSQAYKLVFNDQFIPQKIEKQEIIVKDYEIAEDKSDECIEKTEENEDQVQNKIINDFYCGDPFIRLPEYYQYQTFNLNPFMNNDLLLKAVIKRDQLFFFVQIFYTFDPSLEQFIYYEQALAHSFFILKVDSMIYKSGWDCEIILTFEQVVEKLIKPYTEFTFFKFLYTKGFTSKQKESIKKGLEKYLQVKDCQFIINWESQIDQLIGQNEDILNKSAENQYYTNEGALQNKSIDEDIEVGEINGYDQYSQLLNYKFTNNEEKTNNKQGTVDQIQKNQNDKSKKKKLQFSKSIPEDKFSQKEEEETYKIEQKALCAINLTELLIIVDRNKKPGNFHLKYSYSTNALEQENQKVNTTLITSEEKFVKSREFIIKHNDSKLPVLVNDTTVVEFKSNLDVKMLAQQGLTKLINYETPAREEDYCETFNLLNRNDLVVLLKFVETEQKSFHNLLIYRPLSKTPLSSIKITDINILERFLNLKWLDSQVVTLLKKQHQYGRRKLLQPHINQGLSSIDNLKKTIFNYFFQEKTQMNGQKINLRPVFSVEVILILNKFFKSISRQ